VAKTKQATKRRRRADGEVPKRSRATQSTGTGVESVDITPTPRILKVLGEIEFAPWQCIAELVDNSFDEFLAIKRSGESWKEPFEVSVDIPAPSAKGPDAAIVFSDNGRGMTLNQVTNAAKAGWTANDPFSKLGLFGMGFNVATARLGKVTRLLTTRAGDPEWVGLEIDLDNLGEDFAAPVVRRKKSSQNEHGIRVEVAGLDSRSDWLRRTANHKKLRETLGGVYAYLLEREGFRFSVNDVAVKPIRHCVWGSDRSVTRRKETIPAVIDIDKSLPDRAVCHDCSTWQDVGNKSCDECGGKTLEVRERRIWGWVGIQRYLDNKEFGIDFLRNGRKILRFDKSLFQWNDPDDPAAQGDVEYPIELPANQGRIVGEIHLDHVPVIYTKDAFDKSDRGWRIAVKTIRGEGPLLPEAAKRAGYEPSDAPLAQLHRGYRRNDPGKNYLTPGNGKSLINNLDWKKKFQAGDPEYQDDHIWWEAVVRHDEIKAAEKKAKEEREEAEAQGLDDPTKEFEGGGEDEPKAKGGAEEDEATAEPKTERERVEALRNKATVIPELDAQFSAIGIPGQPMKLTAYGVRGVKVTVDGKRVPVWLAAAKRGAFAAFVDLEHPHFQQFDDDPEDLVLQEVAAHLIARTTGETPPFSAVYTSLKERYLGSHTIDEAKLDALATQTLTDLKDRMVDCVQDNPERPWQNALNAAERDITQDRIIRNLRVADADPLIEDGSYLRHVPDGVIPRIVEEWPAAFFDGRMFESPYADVESPSARRSAVSLITGYLDDLSWLADSPHPGRREQLIRARLSLQLLPDELVDAAE
jgi:hypothetical protein